MLAWVKSSGKGTSNAFSYFAISVTEYLMKQFQEERFVFLQFHRFSFVIVGKAWLWECICRHAADKKQGSQAETRAWCDFQRPIQSRDLLPGSLSHGCSTTLRVPRSEEDTFKQEPVRDISDSSWNKLIPHDPDGSSLKCQN